MVKAFLLLIRQVYRKKRSQPMSTQLLHNFDIPKRLGAFIQVFGRYVDVVFPHHGAALCSRAHEKRKVIELRIDWFFSTGARYTLFFAVCKSQIQCIIIPRLNIFDHPHGIFHRFASFSGQDTHFFSFPGLMPKLSVKARWKVE